MKWKSADWQNVVGKKCSVQSKLDQKIGGGSLVFSEKVVLELTSETQSQYKQAKEVREDSVYTFKAIHYFRPRWGII